jgi:phosphate starvation-inducible protein PhoH
MFCRLDAQDVVRNRLVSRIVEAYAAFDALTTPTKPSTKR